MKVEEVFESEGVAAAAAAWLHPHDVVCDKPLRSLSLSLSLSLALPGDVLHSRCVFSTSAFGGEMFLTARPPAASECCWSGSVESSEDFFSHMFPPRPVAVTVWVDNENVFALRHVRV